MSTLVIVESPAKAKTISRFLGPKYRVEASFGHVRDLPEKGDEVPEDIRSKSWGRLAVDTEGDFTPYYVVPKDKSRHIATLRAALKDADRLLLATDEDREGESISWHLLQVLKPRIPVQRIVFHEITEEAIREALENPRDIDQSLVSAQESRRILDRLYGYSLSPVLWKKVQGGLSAGRVQSVAIRLLVEREEDRQRFRKAEYWNIEAVLEKDGTQFKAALARLDGRRIAEGRDFDPATGELKGAQVHRLGGPEAQDLASALQRGLPWRVKSVEERPGTRQPSPPFTTSTLQQEANRKLGFSSKKTMQIAQRLYEGVDLGNGEREGLITYMRTDSTTLSDKALREAEKLVKSAYGPEYHAGFRSYQTKTRNAQEAHEAIRPTHITRTPRSVEHALDGDDLRLYELIWKRTVASQMADARLKRTNVVIEAAAGARQAEFEASGTTILFPGFLRAYVEGSDDPVAQLGDQEVLLPSLAGGEPVLAPGRPGLTLSELQSRQKETLPPARYTEAALIKKLEEEGIGRPSTYASIIGTIQDRGYVLKKKNALVPTFTAFAVVNLLRNHFAEYVDIKFTAKMEDSLDDISNGRADWLDFVRTFYRGAGAGSIGLESRIAAEEPRIEFPAIPLGTDPESGLAMCVRVGRYGPYVQRGEGGAGNVASVPGDMAPGDLTLAEAAAILANKNAGPRVIGTHPETEEKVYAAKGRFGPYVQLGEGTDSEKPRRASLPAGVSEEEVTLEEALRLLSLPRDLGRHPENGTHILAGIGRYGPYVKMGDDFRSLEEGDDVYTIGLDRAVELLAAPKKFARRQSTPTTLRELGASPTTNKPLRIMDGRYGAYVTDGEANATLPKGTAPGDVTVEQALELLAARAAKGPSKGRKPFARKAASANGAAPRKAPAPKKAAAKKPAAAKTGAKKSPAKKKT